MIQYIRYCKKCKVAFDHGEDSVCAVCKYKSRAVEKEIKCQCPSEGELVIGHEDLYDKEKELPFVNHKPNKCKCKNELKYYQRGKKKLWLCSNCCMWGDKLI